MILDDTRRGRRVPRTSALRTYLMRLTERIALEWRPPVDVPLSNREARHPSVIAALQRPGSPPTSAYTPTWPHRDRR